MRQAIDAAMASRWLELASGSAPWPCEFGGAAAVTLRQPAAGGGVTEPPSGPGFAPRPPGAYHASAALDPSAFQDLVEVLPDLIKIAAGVR
jgi:hypothetical protein